MADRLERLVNLVIALRETRRPLTAAEIRRRVAGYGQDDHEAFRRMFERDKADLRALGVPLETAPLDVLGEQQGYRIDPERYDLPALDFPADELMALAVAVDATGLADSAASGLRKLEIDAGGPGASATGSGTAVIDAPLAAPNLEVLAGAQLTRTVVRFSYRTAEGDVGVRTLDPYALVHRRGRWYVLGRDHERAAERAFRLDRIDGAVRMVGEPEAFAPPAREFDVDAVVPDLPEGSPRSAVVDASPEIAWQVARSARGAGTPVSGGWTRFSVPLGDPDTFIGWALEQGPEVVVVEPEELRARIVTALRRLAEEGP